MRNLWRAGRTLFAILVGAVLALAVASPAGAVVASTPAIAVQQGATCAYDPPAYVYDGLVRPSSRSAATTGARGSLTPPGVVSWETSALVFGFGVAAETGAASAKNVLIAQPRQLQAKFGHAADFGVAGNYNSVNAAKSNEAIFEHINAPGTTSIRGTYRGDPVTHFLDPTTGVNVISRDGVFVSGWKLNPDQLANVLRNGSLGGG